MKRILVIDDDELEVKFYERICKGIATVDFASSGERGIQLFKDIGADLILLDLRLPGIDGIEVLRQIRALDKNVPIKLMSTLPEMFQDEIQQVLNRDMILRWSNEN